MKKVLMLMSIVAFLWSADYTVSNGQNINDNEEQIYLQQIKQQNKLLIEAIDKFGAKSKDEVISIYAQGIKERNGALQYSVMCPKLKESFKQDMENNQNYSWVTGYSSPWVKDYKVIYEKKNNNCLYTVVIKFYWETSSGPFNESETKISIINKNNRWCITKIENK